MTLAYPLPWWLALLLAAGIGGLTYAEYRRPLAPLTPIQRGTLAACRALVFAVLVVFLFRPIVLARPQGARDAIVPVLVDRSRSMRLNDAEGQSRLVGALSLLNGSLLRHTFQDASRPRCMASATAWSRLCSSSSARMHARATSRAH